MRKEQYLSDLTKAEIRKLFIERLLDNCNYIFQKKFNIQDIDQGDENTVRSIYNHFTTRNDAYEEIILATTSPELDTVAEILKVLGYDNSIYLAVKNQFKNVTQYKVDL